MSDENAQITLRDSLAASFDAAEASQAAEAPQEVAQSEQASQSQSDQAAADRARDEQGRFAAKQAADNKAQQQTQVDPNAQATSAPSEVAPVARPTTWKKEYLGLYDKMASGTLTQEEGRKLADYNVQREREYATGVSTYRAEAQNARHLTESLAPYASIMQRQNMSAPAFIKNLGDTYAFLVDGSPQQKINAFVQLARDTGIPLGALGQAQGNGLDPVVPHLMQQIQDLSSKVNTVTGWREQQEQQAIQGMISKFEDAATYPHFESVRSTMAQLLTSGLAADLDQAYAKAVRMTDEVWTAEQERQAQLSAATQQPNKAVAVAKAKAQAVSPRSTTPIGTPKTVNAKDVRSSVEAAWDAHTGSGRL